jgi:predicted  nucleic acid-binding Zn-ribbon protein
MPSRVQLTRNFDNINKQTNLLENELNELKQEADDNPGDDYDLEISLKKEEYDVAKEQARAAEAALDACTDESTVSLWFDPGSHTDYQAQDSSYRHR